MKHRAFCWGCRNPRREHHQTFYWSESYWECVLNNKYPMNKMLHQNCLTVPRPEIGECGKTPTRWSQSKDWFRCAACLHKSQLIKGQFKPQEQLWINKTFIIRSVVCAMQTMSASRVDTYINVRRNISDRQSATTLRPGGLLWEFLGGDVPLGLWNPYPIPELDQLNFATLSWSKLPKFPHLSTLLKLIWVNLNLPIWFLYIFEWKFLVSLV